MALETTASLKQALDAIEQRNLDLQSNKELIATTTSGRGVPTNGSDSFQTIADNIDSIKTKLPILEGDAGVTEDNEGNVYGVIGYENKKVYEAGKGIAKVWECSLGFSTIGVDNLGYVYGHSSSNLTKISPDGEVLWTKSINFTLGSTSSIICKGENVYISDSLNNILKLDKSNAEIIWNVKAQSGDKRGTIIFVDDEGNVYGADGYSGYVSKFNSEGVNIWAKKTHTNAVYTVTADKEGFAYSGGVDGYINKHNLSGGIVWKYMSGLGVSPESIYSLKTDSKNNVYSVGASTLRKDSSEGDRISTVKINSLNYDFEDSGVFYASSGYMIKKITMGGEVITTSIAETNPIYSLFRYDRFIYARVGGNIVKYIDDYTIQKMAVIKEREVQ